jgi:hypothetical protein
MPQATGFPLGTPKEVLSARVPEGRAMDRLLVPARPCALCLPDVLGSVQSDFAIDDASSGVIELGGAVHQTAVVAEQSCLACGGMRPQRVVGCAGEVQGRAEEWGDACLACFGFRHGASKASQEVVGILEVSEASVSRVVGVSRGEWGHVPPESFCPFEVPFAPGRGCLGGFPFVCQMRVPFFTSAVFWHERVRDDLVSAVPGAVG